MPTDTIAAGQASPQSDAGAQRQGAERTAQSFLTRALGLISATLAIVAAALAILAVASYFELSQAEEFHRPAAPAQVFDAGSQSVHRWPGNGIAKGPQLEESS